MPQIKNFRWGIAGLLAAATALNYLDRQTFPNAVNAIKDSIPIDSVTSGKLDSFFLFGYGTMYATGGWIMDRMGTRAGYALMIIWWSTANFAIGTVETFFGLAVFRLLLGLGEGGGFPGSAKAVSEWIPPKDRSFAFGIFNTGSALGAIVATPLVGWIMLKLNWRWAFFITGGAGFVWVLFWLIFYTRPERSRFLSTEEREMIEEELGGRGAGEQGSKAIASSPAPRLPSSPARWIDVFRHKETWAVMGAKFLSDAAWYFYALQLPRYLYKARGLNLDEIKNSAWIPWVFAGLGSFGGGWLSSFLYRRFSLDAARKIALGISAALMPVTLLISSAPLSSAIAFFCVAYFGHQFFSTIMQTLPADLFPSRVVGSVAGLVGAAGAFGGMFFAWFAGQVIEAHGYAPVFAVGSACHPLAFGLILLFVRPVRRIDEVMK